MKEQTFVPPTLGIAGAYLFLFTLVFWPVFDFLNRTAPFHFGSAAWRYGAVGLMASSAATPIMGLVFSMALAFALRHRLVIRGISIVCLMGVGFMLLAMLSLALDVLQLWKAGVPEGMASPRFSGMVAEIKLLSGCLVIALCGVGGWQASRPPAKTETHPEPATLVRSPGSTAAAGKVEEH